GHVTGVQTCALPIFGTHGSQSQASARGEDQSIVRLAVAMPAPSTGTRAQVSDFRPRVSTRRRQPLIIVNCRTAVLCQLHMLQTQSFPRARGWLYALDDG